MRILNISSLTLEYKCEQMKHVCLLCVKISRQSLNIRKSVLIQSDFPPKLTINRNILNMVNFCGISHVSPAISKYLLRYEQMSITSLNKNNDVSNTHIDNLYALVLLHFNLQMQHPRVFPLISNAPMTRAGEITLSCSRKFSPKLT